MPDNDKSSEDSLVSSDSEEKSSSSRLGSYTIPKSSMWGASDGMRGKASNGCQEEFYDYCKALQDANAEKGNGQFLMGSYGYISKQRAWSSSNSGNQAYLTNLRYFGTGLAWEIKGMSSKTRKFVEENAASFGLRLMQTTSSATSQASALKSTSVSDKAAQSGLTTAGGAVAQLNALNAKLASQSAKGESVFDEITRKIAQTAASVSGGNVALEFLVPVNVIVDEDAKGVEYGGDVSGGDYSSEGDSASVVQAAYFVANQFRNLQEDAMSEMLMGERAIANDVTLWSSVQAALAASMRACSSGPDGSFIAWYPDYWGVNGLEGNSHDAPYLTLEDIELVNLTVSQSDDEFYSHVFTAGVDINGGQDPMKLLHTIGVVSIESNTSASMSNAMANLIDSEGDSGESAEASGVPAAILKELIYIPEGEEWRYSPKELYRRYGARPMVASKAAHLGSMSTVVDVNNPSESDSSLGAGSSAPIETDPQYILPFLCALYEFMEHWANQYKATLEMTFMPELFPGCRVKVKSFDISFYVQSVTHNINYESGFTTTAKCICPVGSLVSGMVQPKSPESDGKK